jgi:hypothetical protein
LEHSWVPENELVALAGASKMNTNRRYVEQAEANIQPDNYQRELLMLSPRANACPNWKLTTLLKPAWEDQRSNR